MSLGWEGDAEDAAAAARAREELEALVATQEGEPIRLGNEFSEVWISKVHTRNGVRLLIRAPRTGQWITLDPLETESLTWQNTATFSAMVGNPYGPLFPDEPHESDE